MKKNRPVDKLYKQIAIAQDRINTLRNKCKHKKTHMGLYSWRIGAVDNAELCSMCDALIQNSNTAFGGWQSSNIIGDNTTSIVNINPLGETK